MISRRNMLLGGGAILGVGAVVGILPRKINPFANLSTRPKLAMPQLIDSTQSGRFELSAKAGKTEFFKGKPTPTIGFNQAYLGPIVRMRNGPLQPIVSNNLPWPVSSHWHGLLVPGEHDGGPHLEIASNESWKPEMEIAQTPCTAFFHTHVHGRTGQDVYAGLAGIIHVSDGRDSERGLPSGYGVDDLTLVLQDRRFDEHGNFRYSESMMDTMHGMTGDTMVINGQIDAIASVPKGIVRLRLVNASNARIYSLFSDDGRPLHLIATDGGYLPKPVELDRLRLSPGERAEILIDFQNGKSLALMSEGDPNQGMGGMMGRARGVFDNLTGLRQFPLIPFVVDERLAAVITRLPDDIGGTSPDLSQTAQTNVRRFSLDMGMGSMSINEQPFAMGVINERIRLGSIEKWIVTTNSLAHPFHIHGVSFKVVKENGHDPLPENSGWKDTVLVDGETELLVHFTQPSGEDAPFMYHCHILEHEDAGMMGQFTVT